MSDTTKTRLSVYAIILGWFVTLVAFVYNVATINANYAYRLDNIEKDIASLEVRADSTDSFRIDLTQDLAEIKTDLLWIRNSLENRIKD